jgi:hypothetical protein
MEPNDVELTTLALLVVDDVDGAKNDHPTKKEENRCPGNSSKRLLARGAR